MFVNVGRFRFRSMEQREMEDIMRRIGQDVPSLARDCQGFRSVSVVRPGADEVMMVWEWDSEADWNAAGAKFGPALQEYVVPNLSGPPDRMGGEALIHETA